MAMQTGSPDKLSAEINATPMIDVLLVLLIIFMVIVPSLPRGEKAALPQPAPSAAPARQDAVVLELLRKANGQVAFRVNQQDVARVELPARLQAIFAARADRTLFLKGDDQIAFNQVADVIDISHAAGVQQIGLMTPQLQAGNKQTPQQ